MQLFVTPLLIVSVIIGVFFLVKRMAKPDERPQVMVERIERMDHRSWQQALALANQLRDRSSNALRTDRDLAQRLSDLLADQLLLTTPSEDRIRLQIYLCRALGEFEVDTGLPALIAAASAEPAWRDPRVRRSAIQAIGMLSAHTSAESGGSVPSGVWEVLMSAIKPPADAAQNAARPEALRIRSTATYVLGLLPTPQARQELLALLQDAEPDVRFNAATGLARQGDLAAVPTLQQMLRWTPHREGEPANESAVEDRQRRDLVVSAALRAVATLAARQPDADLSSLGESVETILQDAAIAQTVKNEARDVSRILQARTSPPAGP